MGEYVTTRRGYHIYQKIRNGRGIWTAIKTNKLGQEIGNPFRITYDQALGFAPIDEAEALGMQLGTLLMGSIDWN